MADRLTERQNEAYEFIRGFVREHRKPPTLAEIGRALGMRSLNAVTKTVRALEAKGHLTHTPNAARGLALTASDDAFAPDDGAAPVLPVVSRTSSAAPDALRKRPAAFLAVDPSLLPRGADPDACLVARAGDDGMNPDGVRKGDYCVIEEADAVENGALAAFLVGEALVIRRCHLANGRLHLRPADRTYTEETFPPGHPGCYLVGRVVAILRKVG